MLYRSFKMVVALCRYLLQNPGFSSRFTLTQGTEHRAAVRQAQAASARALAHRAWAFAIKQVISQQTGVYRT
jgi:hypothetical protein